ncbi:phytanoyl-CoA dioxygenase family protein [Gammaproteobacteria bacterium]|nr:phytanoyl-CoA dioxygenase family protein [Gammaproteobacteria bacterium]
MKKVQRLEKDSDIRSFFREQGYCAVKQVFPESDIKNLCDDLCQLGRDVIVDSKNCPLDVKNGGEKLSLDEQLILLEKNDKDLLREYHGAASRLSSLYALVPHAARYAEKLFKSQPASNNFLKGIGFLLGLPNSLRLSYGWHQDSSHHPEISSEEMNDLIQVWIPIFRPVNEYNGTMSILDCSHKIGQQEFSLDKTVEQGYQTRLPDNLKMLIEDFDELVLELSPGDCFFWDSFLLHKSNLNKSDFFRITVKMEFTCHSIRNSHEVVVGV